MILCMLVDIGLKFYALPILVVYMVVMLGLALMNTLMIS